MQDRTITGGLCWEQLTEKRMQDERALENYGYKVYSQNDEDGIIHEIFRRIGYTTKTFVEFGVQNGLECNSHYLLHQGFSGVWIEADSSAVKEIHIRFRTVIDSGRLKVLNVFIDKDNINGILHDEINNELDLLSIDIDGNDWYIWEAITDIRPRLVCIEYNGKFPPDYAWKQAYHSRHMWDGSDWQGASLKALEMLGTQKGYRLVATNLKGVNAFFVRNDLWNDQVFLSDVSSEALYNPYRRKLEFQYAGHPSRYCLVDQKENMGIYNYFKNKKEYLYYRNRERGGIIKRIIKKISRCWNEELH